jgi:flagellar protein FlbB
MILSPKIRLLYLIFLNLFLIGIFIYLLDLWGLISLKEYLPFIEKEPPKVDQTQANVLLLEKEKLEKEKQIIEEEKVKINELKLKIEEQQKAIEQKEKELNEEKESIEKQKLKIQEVENARKQRNKMIEDMAKRLNAMPPQAVIEIIQGWKNIDIVDVFLKMEQIAEEEGTNSIVPYLLSQLPPERASVITSLMMDEGIQKNLFQN